MDIKELRVGNVINFPFINRDVYVLGVNAYESKNGCILYKISVTEDSNLYCEPITVFKPIQISKQWLLEFGFENWGKGKFYENEYDTYERYVLHNVLDGTSNFEVHVITYNGINEEVEYVISCDDDERINWGTEIKYIHQLQNLYFALTQTELTLS